MIPENITTRDEAYNWLLRHGYPVDLANEDLAAWEAGEAPASDEPEIIVEPVIFEDEEELYDEDGEEYDEEEYEFEEDEEEADYDEDDGLPSDVEQ